MRILSLDTSFSFFNLSVCEGGRVELLHYIDSSKKTLENLPKVLSHLGIEANSFDAFAVSKGVGYLTSLRIGVTFMKTLAYTLDKPIVGYENLHLLLENTPAEGKKISYLKVSTNILYRVIDGKNLSEVRLYKGEELEGLGISLEAFSEVKLGNKQVFYPFFPFSAYGALHAYKKLLEDPAGDEVFSIEPIYVKPPV